jgi:hypothetical protein
MRLVPTVLTFRQPVLGRNNSTLGSHLKDVLQKFVVQLGGQINEIMYKKN